MQSQSHQESFQGHYEDHQELVVDSHCHSENTSLPKPLVHRFHILVTIAKQVIESVYHAAVAPFASLFHQKRNKQLQEMAVIWRDD